METIEIIMQTIKIVLMMIGGSAIVWELNEIRKNTQKK